MIKTPEGPLDMTRHVNEEACALDLTLAEQPEVSEADLDLAKQHITELDQRHPLIGHEVVVYGMAIMPSMDDAGNINPLTIAPDQPNGGVEGIYRGFALLPIYVPEAEDKVTMMVHMVETGTERYTDEYFNVITKNNHTFVCVQGSEVVGKLPLQAHSLYDLRNDPGAEEFDRILFEREHPQGETIHRLGKLANRLFRNQEYLDNLNQQRVSYLNALGVLDRAVFTAQDMIVATRDDYLANKNVGFSAQGSRVSLSPDMFDILPGYVRLPDETILMGGPPELFATTQMANGQQLMMPMKSVEDIRII